MVYMQTFLILVLSGVPAAFCIRCFECNSFVNPECVDIKQNDTQSRFLVTCDDKAGLSPFCRKTYFKLLDEARETRIARGCGYHFHRGRNDTCTNHNTDFKDETSCQCFGDHCNNSISYRSSSFILFGYCLFIVAWNYN